MMTMSQSMSENSADQLDNDTHHDVRKSIATPTPSAMGERNKQENRVQDEHDDHGNEEDEQSSVI
jgi:hypothetical protein